MSIRRGALVPHAPLLLPELESPEVATSGAAIRRAVSSVDVDADVVVVASPHGSRTGVYRAAAGSLGEFGVPGDERWWFSPAEVVRDVELAWGRPAVDGSVDHGVFVPLSLLDRYTGAVVAVAFAEGEASAPDVADLIEALDGLDARVFLLCSANLSAGLTARAPLTYRRESEEVESKVVAALSADPEVVIGLADDLAGRGGSCSASTTHLYGRAFAGGRSELLAYEKPVGVGYPVALATTA